MRLQNVENMKVTKDSGYGSSTCEEKIEDSMKYVSYGSTTNYRDEIVYAKNMNSSLSQHEVHAGKHDINESEETRVEVYFYCWQVRSYQEGESCS
jgi:hypothetical protein